MRSHTSLRRKSLHYFFCPPLAFQTKTKSRNVSGTSNKSSVERRYTAMSRKPKLRESRAE